MHVLVRLLMIVVGIVCGSLAAGFFLMYAETLGLVPPADVARAQVEKALFVNGLILSLVSALYAFVPAFALGLVAEIARWRSIIFFALSGAAIGAAFALGLMPDWIEIAGEGEALVRNPPVAYPAIGIVGGAVYWLVTGSRAGLKPVRG